MDALKKMGIDYVFDTSFTADLTIMEEGNEFLRDKRCLQKAGIKSSSDVSPDPDAFQDVRNDGKGVKSAEIRIGDAVVKAAVVSGLGNTRRLLQQIERGKFTMILWKSWPVLAAVSEAVGRSSMMAKSLLTSVDRTSISSTKTHLFASPTRTRTFRSSMQTSWGSHYPTRPICFCTRITRHGKCQDLRNN